jgi:sigma-B regulation protein RsbU (phosphoserine phosphatase)
MRNGQVEEKKVIHLKRELKLKEFQFNSIYEFSESIYSHFQVENVIRIYFSTLMGQLGVSRVFLYDSGNKLFERRGFKPNEAEIKTFARNIKKLDRDWFYLRTEEIAPEFQALKELLESRKIHALLNVSESDKRTTVVGMGAKLKKNDFATENLEYAFFVSKFALSAIENALMIDRLIESKRIEHEMKIARDIQLSLLPQSVPQLNNFEIAFVYEPINEVGGDYYDIMKKRNGGLPVLIADVEGKGLSAALLAASSQAIFRSLNELYFFEPPKFIAKANSMICDFTGGSRFITLFWMLVDDDNKSVTYVNAGHASPTLISGDNLTQLTKGGFLTGFVDDAQYENETISLKPGDVIVAFTDGVPEVENHANEEFGEDAVIDYIKRNKHLSAAEMAESLTKAIKDFSEGKKFRDDFTLIILKAK